MKTSAKLTIRLSEVRSEINKLEPGDKTVEKRRELMASLDTIEAEFRTAVLSEEKEGGTEHRGGDGLTAEERERRGLESKAELRNVVSGILNGREPSGAEAEYQKAMGTPAPSCPGRWSRPGCDPTTPSTVPTPRPRRRARRTSTSVILSGGCSRGAPRWRLASRCRPSRLAT